MAAVQVAGTGLPINHGFNYTHGFKHFLVLESWWF